MRVTLEKKRKDSFPSLDEKNRPCCNSKARKDSSLGPG